MVCSMKELEREKSWERVMRLLSELFHRKSFDVVKQMDWISVLSSLRVSMKVIHLVFLQENLSKAFWFEKSFLLQWGHLGLLGSGLVILEEVF